MPYLLHQKFYNYMGTSCDDLHIDLQPNDVVVCGYNLKLDFSDKYYDHISGKFMLAPLTRIDLTSGIVAHTGLQIISFYSPSEKPVIAQWFWTKKGNQVGPIKTKSHGTVPSLPPQPPSARPSKKSLIFANDTKVRADDLEVYFLQPDVVPIPSGIPGPGGLGNWPSSGADFFDFCEIGEIPSGERNGGGKGTCIRFSNQSSGTGVPSGHLIEIEFESHYDEPILMFYSWTFNNEPREVVIPDLYNDAYPHEKPWDPWPPPEKEKKLREEKISIDLKSEKKWGSVNSKSGREWETTMNVGQTWGTLGSKSRKTENSKIIWPRQISQNSLLRGHSEIIYPQNQTNLNLRQSNASVYNKSIILSQIPQTRNVSHTSLRKNNENSTIHSSEQRKRRTSF